LGRRGALEVARGRAEDVGQRDRAVGDLVDGAAEEAREAAGPELHADGPAAPGEDPDVAPAVDAVDGGSVRLGDEGDGRGGDDLLAVRRTVPEIPPYDPVALDQMGEVRGRRGAPQREDAPDRLGAEDAARAGRRARDHLADSSKTPPRAARRIGPMSTGYGR